MPPPPVETAAKLPLNLAVASYQLLHVGVIRPQLTRLGDHEVVVEFEQVSSAGSAAAASTRLRQPIPMRFASLLVPGSHWSASGQLLAEGHLAYPDGRTVDVGEQPLCVRKLAHLFPPNAARPTLLRTADPHSWYAVVEAGAERVLIPCFELLRTFYYQATGGLSSYFFSRLPLDTLCWPLAAPLPANDFTAHFYVAATLRHQQEARVLAELLFNSAYRTTLQLTQAHLALVWYKCQQAHRPAEAHAKVDLRLGRAVAVTTYGASFTVGSQAYFWVSRLAPPLQWFSFRRVVYHPLALKLPLNLPFAASAGPIFTDMLHERRSAHAVMPATGLPADFRHFGRHLRSAAVIRPAGPLVVRAFPWATCSAPHAAQCFAAARSQEGLWGRPDYWPAGTAVVLPVNTLCEQLLHCLQERGCLVQRIEVNNPAQQFGPGQSVFPYACPPVTQTHLPDRRQRPLTIARLGWGGGNFYLFSVLDAEEVVLVYRADLALWRSEDYNRFLLLTLENLFDWRAAGQRLAVLTRQPHIVCVKWQQSADRLAWAFHQQAIGAVAYYNWQASKEQAIQNLPPLPAGSVAQAVHQVRLYASPNREPVVSRERRNFHYLTTGD